MSSLYKALTYGGVTNTRAMLIWKSPTPLKVKIFIWMAVHDRIQCGVQLKKRSGQALRSALCVTNMKHLTTYSFNAPGYFSVVLLERLPGVACVTDQLFIVVPRDCGKMLR
jgi:hypothetical protein